MNMKRILFFILFIGIFSCQLNQSIYVETDYPGEYYVFLTNEIDGSIYALVLWGEKRNMWAWSDKEYALGGPPSEITIEVVKVLGVDYPDYGVLSVELYRGDEVIVEAIAQHGIERAIVRYSF